MPEPNHTVCRFFLFLSLLLSACGVSSSISAKIHSSPEWVAHQKKVSNLTHYQTCGAFAYLSSDQKVYARFNWHQISANRYRLILTNPLGATEMDINIQLNKGRFINKQGKCYTGTDPEMMIKKLAGIPIPINDLRQWMLGLPGHASNFTLDSRGYLHTLHQCYNGQIWTVNYQKYYEEIVPAMPERMQLNQGDNCIKLKMDSWRLS
ncbi:lipoprotein insertase outer membrane protein LolB [Candidatus Steffania adelgidicola]|uniref:lipoprotein insertase outer membrane protein LolB n=1 Tax=Candidatus Steffania adelgidicola TaxID=1076626 RepID=UPI001D00D772|nr:lipoprotein insertase outer membrane protein LolB [Candidatus Steffania adelgidicola]UDG79816.1 Outer-membrane lipoprotein LolB [Candidatus Steffania adelgidicola]